MMNQSIPPRGDYQARVWKSTLRLACWTGAWLISTAVLTFGPRFLWDQALLVTLVAAGVNVGMGVGVIVANTNYLAELDELQRRVQLNAMGITLGVAVMVGVPYSVLDGYGMSPFHADISHLLMLMSVTFLISIAYGTWRYR